MVNRHPALRPWMVGLLLALSMSPARADEVTNSGTQTATIPNPIPNAIPATHPLVPKKPWLKVRIISAQPGPNGTIQVELDVVSPSQDQIDLVSRLDGQPIASVSTAKTAAQADGGMRGLTLPKRYRMDPSPAWMLRRR